MKRIGVIGLNEGNGHPYSYSAVFNGYDDEALKECPYVLIRDYLPREQRNEVFVEGAKVTHIWTQDRKTSELLARVAKIPHIVESAEDLIGKVDGILLLRDDVENHWRMAEPFLKARLPIYIDKLIAHDMEDLQKFIDTVGDGYPFMAGSSSRYTRHVEQARKELDISRVRTIQGVSRAISRYAWLRYAPHLMDGIFALFGADVETVQNIGEEGFEIVHMRYRNGLHAVLQLIEDQGLPIQFTCYFSTRDSLEDDGAKNGTHEKGVNLEGCYTVPYADYFHSYRQTMIKFTHMLLTGEPPIPFDALVKMAKIIIAGDISRREGNRKVFVDELG